MEKETMEKGVHEIDGKIYYESWLGFKLFIGGFMLGLMVAELFFNPAKIIVWKLIYIFSSLTVLYLALFKLKD